MNTCLSIEISKRFLLNSQRKWQNRFSTYIFSKKSRIFENRTLLSSRGTRIVIYKLSLCSSCTIYHNQHPFPQEKYPWMKLYFDVCISRTALEHTSVSVSLLSNQPLLLSSACTLAFDSASFSWDSSTSLRSFCQQKHKVNITNY